MAKLTKQQIAAQRVLAAVKEINLLTNIKRLRHVQKRLWKLGL